MSQRSRNRNELIVSYMFLRQAVGWIGALLPIVLRTVAYRPGTISEALTGCRRGSGHGFVACCPATNQASGG